MSAKKSRNAVLSPSTVSHSLRNRIITFVLLILIVIGLLLAIPGLHNISHTITRMTPIWLMIAIIFEILSCISYVFAFLLVFRRVPVRLGARIALSELAFGGAVSVGGAGSLAVGSWLLIERGAKPARVAERSTVLFLLTSAINLITLFIFSILNLVFVSHPRRFSLSLIPAIVCIVVFCLFLVLPKYSNSLSKRFKRYKKISRILGGLSESIHDTIKLLLHPDWKLLGAIGYLWFDILVLIVCFRALGKIPPIPSIVLAYQLGYLADIIPIPGNIGALDASVIGLMLIYGIPITLAAAATIVYHAIVLWVPAVIGSVSFIVLKRSKSVRLVLKPIK